MKISTNDLVQKLKLGAMKVVSEQEAEYYAQETVETHVRKSPRSNPLKSSIKDLEATIKHKDNEIEYTVDLPSFVSINFQRQGPLIYIKKIHDDLEAQTEKNGMAMAAFTNSQSMHTLHTWVQGLAKRGLLAIAVCNGGPAAVVPHNGTKGIFGTNPMAYGIPGRNGEIHCVDMATSEIPYFEILDANKNKQQLKERSAVDAKGEFTVDASQALDFSQSEIDPVSNIVPIGGGYKGYYITYLMEVLTSALIGMPSGPEMSNDFKPEEHGSILIVFNPKAMGTLRQFKATIEVLHNSIKSQTPKNGEEVRIPGEGNNQKFSKLMNGEIEVDDSLITKLEELGELI